MGALGRTLLAFVGAVLTSFILASAFHTHQILSALSALGVDIPFTTRITATVRDMAGFATKSSLGLSFPMIIAAGLCLGFLVAFVVKRLIKPLAPIAYIVAGAAAIGAIHALMTAQFGIHPIAGARGTMGMALQILAGGAGGLMFTVIRPANP